MISYNIDSGEWIERKQNKMQSFSRRNHIALRFNKFMVIFGGINEFNHQINETVMYNLEEDMWVYDTLVETNKIPEISHSRGFAAFYD